MLQGTTLSGRRGASSDGELVVSKSEVYDPVIQGGGLINMATDFLPEYAKVLYNVRRTGLGKDNVVQDFVYDFANDVYYTLNASGVGANQIHVLNKHTDVRNIDGVAESSTLGDGDLGHQGLSIQPDPLDPSNPYIWTSAGRTAFTDGENYALRCKYVAGGYVEDKQYFKLFNVGQGQGSVSTCISSCGTYLVAELQTINYEENLIRVFDFEKIKEGGSGDYSQEGSFLYEFAVPSELISFELPLQALQCDGEFIYVFTGNGDPDFPVKMVKMNMRGGNPVVRDNVKIGRAEALLDGSGLQYEPEGAAWVKHKSGLKLGLLIASGDVGARINRIWVLGVGAEDAHYEEKYTDIISFRDEAGGGNVSPKTYDVEFYRVGNRVSFSFNFSNIVRDNLSVGKNLYATGFRYLPDVDTVLNMASSGLTLEENTIITSAVLDSSGYMGVILSKAGAGSALMNVEALSDANTTDMLVSGVYERAK